MWEAEIREGKRERKVILDRSVYRRLVGLEGVKLRNCPAPVRLCRNYHARLRGLIKAHRLHQMLLRKVMTIVVFLAAS